VTNIRQDIVDKTLSAGIFYPASKLLRIRSYPNIPKICQIYVSPLGPFNIKWFIIMVIYHYQVLKFANLALLAVRSARALRTRFFTDRAGNVRMFVARPDVYG
jgi:hypothetical protein